MNLEEFPVFMFKSMAFLFCVVSAKEGIGEWGEETAEGLCSQDFLCIRWRGGCGIQGAVWGTGMVVQVLGCGKERKCVSYLTYSFRIILKRNCLKVRPTGISGDLSTGECT